MRALVSILVLVFAPALAGAESDPRAVAIAGEVMEALGGRDGWRATRFLRFDFAVEREGKTLVVRSHTWDRWTGRYRLEARTKEGKPYVALMNVNTKVGSAVLDGKPLEGRDLDALLGDAYGAWVNDTYWLLMPYKMRDPGVTLKLAGEAKEGGAVYDKLALSFDHVGLTPGDRYWAWINRETHLMDRWEFVLEGKQPPPVPFAWKNWKRCGRMLLSDEKVNLKDGTRIYFPVLEVPAALADSVFTTP
jgi:hypothetical protein